MNPFRSMLSVFGHTDRTENSSSQRHRRKISAACRVGTLFAPLCTEHQPRCFDSGVYFARNFPHRLHGVVRGHLTQGFCQRPQETLKQRKNCHVDKVFERCNGTCDIKYRGSRRSKTSGMTSKQAGVWLSRDLIRNFGKISEARHGSFFFPLNNFIPKASYVSASLSRDTARGYFAVASSEA